MRQNISVMEELERLDTRSHQRDKIIKIENLKVMPDAIVKARKTKKREDDGTILDRERSKLEREKHYNNTKQILVWSNATPIRKHNDDGYLCCFCPENCADPAILKRHTLEKHADYNMKSASFMIKTNINSYYVKMDITGLICKICYSSMDNLESLIEHLRKVHHKKIYTDINNRILPFKFNTSTLTCFQCSSTFGKFKALLEHMNTHYKNFVCEICEAGFVTRTMAVAHTNIHKIGTFKCGYCPKVYDTAVKKINHERCNHTRVEKQNKCGLCTSTFKYYHQKQNHLLSAHGVSSNVKCQACDRSFADQRKLRVHVRKHHLMERQYNCDFCERKFFSKSELNDHKVKHTGSKEFQCDKCNKSYGRKKSLNVHMRVHAEER